MKVYVVVSFALGLGWAYVVGVFDRDKFTEDEILERFPLEQKYMIFEKDVEISLEMYE